MTARQFANAVLDHRLLWRAVFMLSLAAIAWLAFTSQPYPVPSFTSDKLNHVIAFTELAVVIRLGWPALHLAIPFLLLVAFGLAIELGQAMVSYRHFSLADLGADVVGIIIGFCLLSVIRSLQGDRSKTEK